MRAFNSRGILIPILLLVLLQFNCVSSRSVGQDEVIDKSEDDKTSTGQVDKANAEPGKSSIESNGAVNEEGIRRFDADVEESEKEPEQSVSDDKPQDDVIAKVVTVEDQVADEESKVETSVTDTNYQKRSVKRKLDPIDPAEIDAKPQIEKKESEIAEEATTQGGEKIQLREIPELIPVKIDHASQEEINQAHEDIARKSLGITADEEEKIDDEEEQKGERSERSSEKKEKKEEGSGQQSIVQKWREQAITLQGQIKNRTFLQYLREQASDVLPDIPKFTEMQLLDALKTISSKKLAGGKESYVKNMNTSMLNESQLEIIKCAEGLVAEKQRQSFTDNMFECIRGLNILNCMRIFIWPIIADNVPESIMQSFPTLPIEVSLSDFIPGQREEKPKSIRSSGSGAHQQRLITPELVVSNILKDALQTNPSDENIPTYIDPKNETLSQLLTPGQLDILKMAEKFLPESARQEFSSKMYSCVRRFEYFSCIKYFAWPMVKQYFPALPEFPDYQSWYPSTISVFPGYPLVPFPQEISDSEGQLPEVIEADSIKNRMPRPETVIVQLLKNTLNQQPRQPVASAVPSLSGVKYITPEQLASIQMAEQLVPLPYRAEFVTRTMNCIRDYNYLLCTKYSTWPLLKQWQPSLPALPDFSSVFGSFFGGLPDFGSFFNKPPINKPDITEIFGAYFPSWVSWGGQGGGGGGGGSGGVSGGGGSGGVSGGGGSGGASGGGSSGGASGGGSSGGISGGSSGAGASGGGGAGSSSGGSAGSGGSGSTQGGATGGASGGGGGSGSSQSGTTGGASGGGSTGGSSGSIGSGGGGGSFPTGGSITWGGSSGSSSSSGGGSGSIGGGGGGYPSFPGTGGIPQITGPGGSGTPSTSGGTISWGGAGGGGSGGGIPSYPDLGGSGGIPTTGTISWGGSGGGGSGGGQSGGSASGGGSSGGGSASIPSGGTITWGGSGGSSGSGESSGQGSGSGSSDSGSAPIPSGGTITWGGGGGSSQGSGSSSSSGGLGGISGSSGTIIAGSGGGGGGSYAPQRPTKIADPGLEDRISITSPYQTLQEKSMEARVMEILYNLRYSIPGAPMAPLQLDRHMMLLTRLSNEQLTILGLAKSILPPPARPDLVSRSLGCLQGGSDFIGCTKNVIWPFLSLYIASLPEFPEDSQQMMSMMMERHSGETDFVPEAPVGPSQYSSIIGQSFPVPHGHFIGQPVQIAARSPLRSGISAKADDEPIISVTGTNFGPIYTDHPETVALNILATLAHSLNQSKPSEYHTRVPAFITLLLTLNSTLNEEQENILSLAEYVLPESSRQNTFNGMLGCLIENNSFQACARDILWPSLAEYYPRLPSFPMFHQLSSEKQPALSEDSQRLIAETDIKTGQHGDATVTITDTRFIPIFGEHPEEVIMKLLKGVQPTSPNQINATPSSIAKSPPFVASFTSQQGDILVVAENLLPESIREVFVMRMNECIRDNNFQDCMRDIAWPTIGQFFPRLPSFPNFGTLPSLTEGKPQQPTLLPPNLEPTAPLAEFPRIINGGENQIQQLIEPIESKLEDMLVQVTSMKSNVQPGMTYLNTEDPITAALITDKQAKVIRMAEALIPEGARPVFVVKMMDCIRSNGFPICSQAVAWPTLRQFQSNIPEFPISNHLLPDIQLPSRQQAIPALQQFGQLQNHQYQVPLRQVQETPDNHHGVLLPAYTASVGTAPVVPAFPGQPTDILLNISEERVTIPGPPPEPTLSRKRRDVINLLEEESSFNPKIDMEPTLNITESDLLKLLANISKPNDESSKQPEGSLVDVMNSTIKDSLSAEQLAILKMVEKLGIQNTKGFMGQVIRCISSLSFIRCMGIFVWPVITSAVPSLLGLPFGRSLDNGIEGFLGVFTEDLERELLARKKEMEHTFFDWYKSLTEEKFESTYGFLKFEGYGNGEIGIRLAEAREGRAKIKDHKHLPSILTIISDIMEDVLDNGRPNHDKAKKDNKRKSKSLVFPLNEDTERSNNDDKIINMFLEKLKSNVTDEDLEYGKRRFTPEDAYRAFEVLFGPRLKARLVNKLEKLQGNKIGPTYENYPHRRRQEEPSKHLKVIPLEVQEKKANLFDELQEEQESLRRHKFTEEQKTKSALTIHLPKLNDEIIGRKMTSSLANIARHMSKNTMVKLAPGVGFLLTFLLQMALAHARAAASMATMLSNMAMGTAMFSMIRQTLFGQTTHPKVKYVYDTDVSGPGISWPPN